MKFIPSKYQQAIADFLKSLGNLIVQACAGSGKTTTVMWLLSLIPPTKKVVLLAFGKDIATEAKQKTAHLSNVDARTFNSLGNRAVCKHLGKKWLNIKQNKCLFILWDMYPKQGGKKHPTLRLYESFVRRLVGLAKNEGIGCLVPDEIGEWKKLIAHHGLYLDSKEANEEKGIEIARAVLAESNERSEHGTLDFDDQIYLPILWDLTFEKFDFIFVDETQDTNRIQQAILKRLMKAGSRLCCGWASADHKRGQHGARYCPVL